MLIIAVRRGRGGPAPTPTPAREADGGRGRARRRVSGFLGPGIRRKLRPEGCNTRGEVVRRALRRAAPPEPPSPPGLPGRPGAGRGAPPRWKCARRRPVAGRGAVPRRPHPRPRPRATTTPPPAPAAGAPDAGRKRGTTRGWRGREERGAGKIRRDHRHGRTRAAGLNPPGGLRGPHPFTS